MKDSVTNLCLHMKESKLFNTIPLYASLIETCSSTKDLKKLKQTHAQVVSLGIYHHDFIRSKLVSAYASCLRIHEAIHIFSRTNRQPTFLYNCLIRAYASLDLHRTSLRLFRQMMGAHKSPDRHTFPSLLKSIGHLSSLNLARQVHGFVVVMGDAGDLCVGNALVTAYAKCGCLGTARKVFDEMRDKNVVTWSSMMSGYAMHGESGEVMRLFEEMVEAGERPDEKVFTAVLVACSYAGWREVGWGFLRVMKERFGVKAGVEHYTCLVDMLGKAGKVEAAEKAVAEMVAEGVVCDEALWRALLGACRAQGKMEVAERVAERVYGRT
ncbi:hypothetical protein Scep_003423 [Stephania cephalantha]|uniref:Pentatricopeptide repeat-containing protein n=1 Tax=Stephania cephalantha TaxID=152367 RepID=A0AAP0PWB5_9MAGN